MSDQTPPKTPTPHETTSDRENGTSAGAAAAATAAASTEAEVDLSANATQSDFRQNHARPNLAPPQPHELTAEWTVRAKLTFARAGENVRREFSSNDPTNPVRVTYKWSTLDGSHTNIENEDDEETTTTSTQQSHQQQMSKGSQQSTPLKPTTMTVRQPLNRQQHHESFRSTTSSNYADYGGADSAFSGSNASKSNQQTASNKQKQPRQQQSFTTSTNGVGSTSASTTATNAGYGTRCRSTCNIIVSAVADFLPADAVATAVVGNDNLMSTQATSAAEYIAEEEPDPFIFNTTASYTILPEKTFEDTFHSTQASRNFSQRNKILNLRDAFSQTSDTETKYFEEKAQRRRDFNRSPNNIPATYGSLEQNLQNKQQQQQQQQRKAYENRRLTSEALLQPTFSGNVQADEGSIFMPSLTPSPTQTFKSASLPRIPTLTEQAYNVQHLQQQQQQHKSSSSEQQKKPRTVHIDVYCTGSEDEEHADAEASSSSSSEEGGSKRYDLESNSTPQTVLDTEQMLLRHQRITGGALPRRIAQQHPRHKQQQHKSESQTDLNIGHAITKSSTAEEVNESKQLLFRKHIGDQRAVKLQTLRQKYIRQSSDDVLSSSYPNSSHSTVRDATCSSISSAVPSTQADAGDSSWKETEEPGEISYSLAKSDSFDYDNSIDRLRIHQMERFWSRSVSEEHTGSQMTSPTHYPQSKFLQPIYEVNSQRSSPFSTPFQRNDTLPSESENFSETDVFNTYPGRSGAIPHYQQHLQKHITSTEQPPIHTQTSLQQVSHFPRNRPGFLQFFGPHAKSHQQDDAKVNISTESTSAPILPDTVEQHLLYPNYQHNFARWKSETRDNLSNPSPVTSPLTVQSQRSSPQTLTSQKLYSPSPQRCGSEAPPTTTTASTFTFQSPAVARRFEMKRDSPAVSETSTIVSGYTPEYLEKAKKFGKVVAVRKPGHHVGPTKNPSCSCESCQRWLSERFQLRGRAFSLGERPILKRPT